ncbi:putative T7SS-secreted protein [Streptomyces sp. NPDC048516]|uniref:putative T7SS-secreted protein n=1 Tax=Streptomyces sp. NPDC048516 TaxID=3365565 RepID=UPI0037248972
MSGISADASKKDLIPGDPEAVADLVHILNTYAQAFGDSQRNLKKVDEAEWSGTAAIEFRKAVRKLPTTLASAHEEFGKAAHALAYYADILRFAQAKAGPIIEDAAEARVASRRYQHQVDDYNKAVDAEAEQLPQRPPETDPGATAMNHCVERLNHLREEVAEAARDCARKLRDAADAAPDEPGFFENLFNKGREFLQGVYEGADAMMDLASVVTQPWNIEKNAMTIATTLDGIGYGVQHPKEFAKGLVNWDMWAQQPARAAGQLAPDIVLDLLTGGGGAAAAGGKGSRAARWLSRLRDGLAGRKKVASRLDENGEPVKKRPTCGEPVNPVNGEMMLPETDLTLPGSLPLVLERTHLSAYTAGGWFGPSWAATLDQHLEIDEEGVVFAGEDGILLAYPHPEPGTVAHPQAGPRWPLTHDPAEGTYAITTDLPTGRTLTFAPRPGHDDETGMPLVAIEDRAGRHIDFLYDSGTGRPTEIHHHGGYRVVLETHPEMPRITALRVVDPADPQAPGTLVMSYGYDETGNLTVASNSSGLPMKFTYDEADRITSWTDRNGTSFGYLYDHRGRVKHTVGPDNGILSGSFHYDEAERITVYTDSLGHKTTYRYNQVSKVIAESDSLGHTTHTTYDITSGAIAAVTDPLGHTTHYEHDEQGNVTRITLPDGSVAFAAYDHYGQPVRITEPSGAVWQHTYGPYGNRLTVTDPMGAQTRYTYDAQGHLTGVTDALGNTRWIQNNAAGLPSTVTDALGQATTVKRDTFGRPTAIFAPLGRTTFMTWTPEGKPAWLKAPDGTCESWEWDAEGNLVAHTDPAGNATRYTHTHFDERATRTDAEGQTHTFSYDTELRLTRVTNPQGLAWTYEYDPAGRLTAETDFNGRTLTYSHDAAGRLVARTNGAGETVTFTRDVRGRTTEQCPSSGSPTTFAYDPDGHLTAMANIDVAVTYERDGLGRVAAETVNGRTTRYTYDAVGRRTSRTTPSGHISTWSYNAAGSPTQLRSSAGDLTFAYDEAGREVQRRFGDHSILTQAWDSADRLTAQEVSTTHPEAANQLLQQRRYAYRADGYLTEIHDLANGTRRFDLDRIGRVTSVRATDWCERYAYDGADNLTHGTAPGLADPGDREFIGTLIRNVGRDTYEHDAQGRLIRTTRRLLNGQKRTCTYTWDAQDKLTDVITPDGARWHYLYDPLGRRIAKQHVTEDGAVISQTDFSWDATRLAEQTTNTATLTWDYAPDTHRPLTQTERRPRPTDPRTQWRNGGDVPESDYDTRFYAIVADLVGTPTELLTVEGELAWQSRTTVWGVPRSVPTGADATTCPLRFPGQYADDETGLHYNNQRYYDPQTARYISPDRLGLEAGPNHHAFVPNTSRWFDALGLKKCDGDKPDGIRFEPSPKHGKTQRGNAAPEPKDPEGTLQQSIPFNPNTTRRVAANHETGEFALFDETHNGTGIYHGHMRTWDELSPAQQSALRKAGLVNKKGKILPPSD